jgi:hypothetical protein
VGGVLDDLETEADAEAAAADHNAHARPADDVTVSAMTVSTMTVAAVSVSAMTVSTMTVAAVSVSVIRHPLNVFFQVVQRVRHGPQHAADVPCIAVHMAAAESRGPLHAGDQAFHVVEQPVHLGQVLTQVVRAAAMVGHLVDMGRPASQLTGVAHKVAELNRMAVVFAELTFHLAGLPLQASGEVIDMCIVCLGRRPGNQTEDRDNTCQGDSCGQHAFLSIVQGVFVLACPSWAMERITNGVPN